MWLVKKQGQRKHRLRRACGCRAGTAEVASVYRVEAKPRDFQTFHASSQQRPAANI